jgi:peptidoglycan/LPS O-acetylase OafA/YrhL
MVRFLNSRPVAWIGVISYSLYLWQSLFVMARGYWWNAFPMNVAITVAVAAGSYYCVERPMLHLRSRFVH